MVMTHPVTQLLINEVTRRIELRVWNTPLKVSLGTFDEDIKALRDGDGDLMAFLSTIQEIYFECLDFIITAPDKAYIMYETLGSLFSRIGPLNISHHAQRFEALRILCALPGYTGLSIVSAEWVRHCSSEEQREIAQHVIEQIGFVMDRYTFPHYITYRTIEFLSALTMTHRDSAYISQLWGHHVLTNPRLEKYWLCTTVGAFVKQKKPSYLCQEMPLSIRYIEHTDANIEAWLGTFDEVEKDLDGLSFDDIFTERDADWCSYLQKWEERKRLFLNQNYSYPQEETVFL